MINTIESNRLLAEFLGNDTNEYGTDVFVPKQLMFNHKAQCMQGIFQFDECYFDTDWNWIMLVVAKIGNTKRSKWSPNTYPCVKITGRGCKISFYGNYEKVITDIIRPDRIKAVYDACIEFIKWYNQQK
jgi:hypothetical protein